jgi:hypothetical protein
MKNRRVILPALVLLAVATGLYFLLNRKKTSWEETYRNGSTQPYGTQVVSELLKEYFPGYTYKELKDPLQGSIRLARPQSSYVFIGDTYHADSTDVDVLLNFVRQGSSAFIAANFIPERLDSFLVKEWKISWNGLEEIKAHTCTLTFRAPVVPARREFPVTYRQGAELLKEKHTWRYVESDLSDSLVLGFINSGYPDFIALPLGKGFLYLHRTPLAFTNYALLKESGLQYASGAFSYLKPGDVYWDEFNKFERKDEQGGGGYSSNPLQYILSQESLRNAWYLLLLTALIYLLFGMRRKQRVIPLLRPPQNSSLEFVKTVGRLFFLQNDHHSLARQKMRLFLIFVRSRYRIANHVAGKELIRAIAIRSGVAESHVESIFAQDFLIERERRRIDPNVITQFHLTLEHFYKHSK